MKKKNILLLSATTLLGVIGASGLATKANAATVTVKPNDTVWDFSQAYHVSVDQIKTANHLQGEDPIILVGQKLNIPTSGAQQATSTAQPDWNQQLAAQSTATASAQAASAAAQSAAIASNQAASQAASQAAATQSANQAAAESANAASAQAASQAATQAANEAAAKSAAAASAQAVSAAAQEAATKSANEAAAQSAAAKSAAASQQAASQAAVVASAQAASAAAQSAAIASNQAASQAAATKAANAAAQQANQQATTTQQQNTTTTKSSSNQTANGNYTFTYYNATPNQGWGDASTTADGTSTASGRDADGYLIAAAGSNIAFGTHIQTPYGEAVVHDRGGAVSGNHIDVLQ